MKKVERRFIISKFKTAWPYQKDAMNLPVKNLAAAISFYETIIWKEHRRTSELIDMATLRTKSFSSSHQTGFVTVLVNGKVENRYVKATLLKKGNGHELKRLLGNAHVRGLLTLSLQCSGAIA